MSLTASRRLLREYRAAAAGASSSGTAEEDLISIAPTSESDLFHWTGVIRGIAGTPYEGGRWKIDITVPATYPLHPPEIKFRMRICHPNISFSTGEVCLDILNNHWSPSWTLESACRAVVALLDAPEPDSPLNVDAANVLRAGDVEGYASLVRYYTCKYAMGDVD
ncbi:ubiquitin-conjugating enzyme/RWD-like protein [Limtongia smithiae]|uniref:ubiquitin-conjugating enzyme/RWD-like protein n=1 Tax=Limtongia smithiae TaxID=1125753 RepID=UPI0034CDBA09